MSKWISLFPSSTRCRALFSSRRELIDRSNVGIARQIPRMGGGEGAVISGCRRVVPKINGGWFRFPHPRALNVRQSDKSTVFRAEGDVAVGLRHDRRLARDRISQHPKPRFRADDEGEETVEIVQCAGKG